VSDEATDGKVRELAEDAAEWLSTLENATPEDRTVFISWLKKSPKHVEEILRMMELDAALLDLPLRDVPDSIRRSTVRDAAIPIVQFSHLGSVAFESLIADLLTAIRFSVQRTPTLRDSGFDLLASYRSCDPFGVEKTESWLVAAKLYEEQRVSVSVLRQALRSLMNFSGSIAFSGPIKGLIVTNGHMTSVAREFHEEIERKAGHELRVIDGTELADLIVQHPELIQRYFGSASPK
jgi:hypothetical protein